MISVAIFTRDEELNLPHCLGSLKPCDDVVVVDSFSTDTTCALAEASGARIFQHEFEGFGVQRMWAFENIVFRHPWILILDADETVPPALWEEMHSRISSASPNIAAFRLKRRFFWEGVWLRRSNLYPSWVVRLVRQGKVRYVNRGHAETQEVQGEVESLEEDLLDQNHKGLNAWHERQNHYAEQEAQYEYGAPAKLILSDLWIGDPLKRRSAWKIFGRELPFRGFFYFVYVFVLKGGFLDGATGLRFCFEKSRYHAKIARRVRELRRAGGAP